MGSGRGIGGCNCTARLTWHTRVVRRSSTGTWCRCDSSKASRVIRYACCASAGSSTGRWAKRDHTRLSCSFCEEEKPTSSATAITRPPWTPVSAADIKVSAATFRPTCFIAVSARRPISEAPSATSSATFSFTDHSAWTSSKCESVSTISVDGVPG